MEKIVIIINGAGGSGKDTVCNIVGKYYKINNVSSITPIKNIAKMGGWKEEKTLKSRKLLSDLKCAFNEYNDLSYSYIAEKYREFISNDAYILFIHIREPEEISRVIDNISTKCITLLIKRACCNLTYGNISDDNVNNYNYDYVYENNKSLLELEQDFYSFFSEMLNKEGII